MGILTPAQVSQLRIYLERSGLTFESLQTEMLDHICCDVELYMGQGLEFEEAIEKVKSQLPPNQFKKIQTETMDAINKKTRPTTILIYASFALLAMATLFKLLRFPGAGGMLIASFAGMAMALVSVLVTNPLIKEKRRGRAALVVLIAAIVAFLASLCFQLLQLPGFLLLRISSVTSFILILSGYAIYTYLHPEKAAGHILLQYVKKDGFGVEKSLIFLLVVGTVIKFFKPDPTFVVFFVLLFIFGGIFYFISSWQYYFDGKASLRGKLALLAVSILAFAMFTLPAINSISYEVRVIIGWVACAMAPLAITIYYFTVSSDRQKLLLALFSLAIFNFSLLNLVIELDLTSTGTSQSLLGFIYNPVFFIFLLGLFIVFFKKPVFRALLIMALGIFVFNYPIQGI